MDCKLLLAFGSYAFADTLQTLLSHLTIPELETLLQAMEARTDLQQLSHVVRTRILVLISHKFDRSVYYIHYESVCKDRLAGERCSTMAARWTEREVKTSIL